MFVLWKMIAKYLQKQQQKYYKQYIYKNNIISDESQKGQRTLDEKNTNFLLSVKLSKHEEKFNK